ncbi:hypothetical protein EDB84DRAFT_1434091 [Lactarius hengduanensis]|nr:hypothetical protein EDB84DRAFT_1434091 [Lactarius hengduanensis]
MYSTPQALGFLIPNLYCRQRPSRSTITLPCDATTRPDGLKRVTHGIPTRSASDGKTEALLLTIGSRSSLNAGFQAFSGSTPFALAFRGAGSLQSLSKLFSCARAVNPLECAYGRLVVISGDDMQEAMPFCNNMSRLARMEILDSILAQFDTRAQGDALHCHPAFDLFRPLLVITRRVIDLTRPNGAHKHLARNQDTSHVSSPVHGEAFEPFVTPISRPLRHYLRAPTPPPFVPLFHDQESTKREVASRLADQSHTRAAAARSRLGFPICGQLPHHIIAILRRRDPISISGATMRPGTDLRQQYSKRISPCSASAGATTSKEEICLLHHDDWIVGLDVAS